MPSKQNVNHKKPRTKPGPTSPPQAELTDEQLQQVVGGFGSSANLPVITNDLVIQSFVTGDINRPLVNGTNWNGQDHP